MHQNDILILRFRRGGGDILRYQNDDDSFVLEMVVDEELFLEIGVVVMNDVREEAYEREKGKLKGEVPDP